MISVITITYNNVEELKATLESIPQGVESIVINGGTCEFTRQYLKGSAVKSISEPDRGISDAFNKGVRLASGDGVCFLNSGDLCIDGLYYGEADERIRSGAYGVVHANIVFDHPRKGKIVRRPATVAGVTYFTHPTLVVARDLMSKVGPFDERFKIAMDFDYFCRLDRIRFTPCFIDRDVVLMDGTGISSSNETAAIAEVVQILRKHGRLSMRLRVRYAVMHAKVVARRAIGKVRL